MINIPYEVCDYQYFLSTARYEGCNCNTKRNTAIVRTEDGSWREADKTIV